MNGRRDIKLTTLVLEKNGEDRIVIHSNGWIILIAGRVAKGVV
jgi:hypothetical protein